MNRLEFLKRGFNSLSVMAVLPMLEACKEDQCKGITRQGH